MIVYVYYQETMYIVFILHTYLVMYIVFILHTYLVMYIVFMLHTYIVMYIVFILHTYLVMVHFYNGMDITSMTIISNSYNIIKHIYK